MHNQQMYGILEKKLSVLCTNADSLLNKLEELTLVICDQESKPHVIAVAESKPKKYSGNIAASECNVKGETDIKIMYNNMASAACSVPLQERCYMTPICY